MKILEINLNPDQYYAETQKKRQIVLHHTVSDPTSAIGDIGSWKADTGRIATYAIIGYDGTLNKCFKSTDWAHHIGVKAETLQRLKFKDYATRNQDLNKQSIGIEIDAWGGLVKSGDKYLNAYGKPISKDLEVIECNWRGFKYFQKYNAAQIATLAELLPILMQANNIPNYGLIDGNFDFRLDALNGMMGIFSHSNYRADKSDLYPDKRIVELLNSLK
jgi:N-acetyl-anhydromuramyl-L-alanine amidase AmpD